MSSTLSQRAVGSVLVIPVGLALLLWPLGTLGVTVLLITLAAREAGWLFTKILGGASGTWAALLLLAPLAGAQLSAEGAAIAGLAALLLFLVGELAQSVRAPSPSLPRRAATLVGTLAVAVWLSPLLLFPVLGSVEPHGPVAPWLTWMLVVVWSADTAALVTGILIGRRKLAPRLSPKKSVEGLVGGVAIATIFGIFTATYLLNIAPLAAGIASCAVACAAEGGDLLESLFKRAAGKKSSSTLIPGHGGILDRIDSLVIAAPVVLLIYLLATP
ncbi:MAG: phosphatidate cytidylyltransferase [Candidatus Limnocylindrus sp.]